MSMQEFIAKIAKGPRAAKDLTWDEAKRAMKALIEGDATPAQVGAFLIAMRVKMESVTELASMTAAARSYVAPVPIPRELGVVDLPSYAGKQDTFHALAAAAIVAASAGASVLMHGYDGIPGRAGNAGVLKALGLPIDREPKAAAEAGDTAWIRLSRHRPLPPSGLSFFRDAPRVGSAQRFSSDCEALESGSRLVAGRRAIPSSSL